MGKCIIAQGKAPISSESVEGNKNVEKCAVHKYCAGVCLNMQKNLLLAGSLYMLLISND